MKDIFKLLPSPSEWKISNSIHEWVRDKEVIVYGAGNGLFTFTQSCLTKFGYTPKLVIDQKFDKPTIFYGISAINIEDFFSLYPPNENQIIFITLGSDKTQKEITAVLKNNGYENIVLAHQIYEYHTHYTETSVLRGVNEFVVKERDKINHVFNFLQDKISQDVFISILTAYLTGEIGIPHLPLAEQYFPSDILFKKGKDRVINCGSYTGDTIQNLNARFGKVEAIACFEPDPFNFQQLTALLKNNSEKFANFIVAYQCGVYGDCSQLRFSSSNSLNSAIDSEGETIIQCITVDNALVNFKPTYINMDIEGAELEALKGAKDTITKYKPDLAISAYHTLAHLWELPLFIESLNVNYRFYFRNHSGITGETVLYAC